MKNYKNKNTLGNWVASNRARKGYRQTDLARLAGTTRGVISNIENDYFTPSPGLLLDVTAALSV